MESFDLDAASDVTLVVGGQAAYAPDELIDLTPKIYNIRVSSHAFKQASRVWRAMISGGTWKESSMAVIKLPEDNPDAMLLILRIAHLHFDHVPTTMEQDELYHVAVLCDKYDCIGLLRPWAHSWTKDRWLSFGLYEPGVLIIAWAFGLDAVLRQEVVKVVRESKATDGQALVLDSGHDLTSEVVLSVVLGELKCSCTTLIKLMFYKTRLSKCALRH